MFTFIAFQIVPGDTALSALGIGATDEAIEAYRIELGLDQNIFVRYFNWLKDAVTGNFGNSIQNNTPVSQLIGSRLPVTVWLAILSFILIILVSIPLGIISAMYQNKWIDRIIVVTSQIGMAVPPFFLGMIISVLFGITLRWFVPGDFISYKESWSGFIGYLIFPAITIAIPKIAMLVKFLRESLLRQLTLDYVRTARSKGMVERSILLGHVLKNGMIPVITFMGMILSDILAGTVLIEQVFNIPGLGRQLLVGISRRDYPVIQGIVLYMAAVVITINFIVDILYQRIDPRVKLD